MSSDQRERVIRIVDRKSEKEIKEKGEGKKRRWRKRSEGKRGLEIGVDFCMDVLGFVTGVGRRVREMWRRNGYGRMLKNRFYPLFPSFVIAEVYGGTRACGKLGYRHGDP